VNIVEDIAIRSGDSSGMTSWTNKYILTSSGAFPAARGVHSFVVERYSNKGFLDARDSEGEGLGSTNVIQDFVITGMFENRIVRYRKFIKCLDEVSVFNEEYTFWHYTISHLLLSRISPMLSIILIPIAFVFSFITPPRVPNSIEPVSNLTSIIRNLVSTNHRKNMSHGEIKRTILSVITIRRG
jgi:hypothetical protein